MTVLAIEGVKIGFVAFTDWRNAPAPEFSRRIVMTRRLARDDWRAVGNAGTDLMCAVPHWGREFCHFPVSGTRSLARKLAEQGIGLVAGHHAHVVQPVERIGQTVVAYGLGDFLGSAFFRQPWPGRIGAMLAVDVSADPSSRGRIAAYDMVPFMRMRDRRRERLVAVAALGEAWKVRVGERLSRVLGMRVPTLQALDKPVRDDIR